MNYKNVNDYEVMYMIRENDEDAVGLMYKKSSINLPSTICSLIILSACSGLIFV